jgi:hypothetical protein
MNGREKKRSSRKPELVHGKLFCNLSPLSNLATKKLGIFAADQLGGGLFNKSSW